MIRIRHTQRSDQLVDESIISGEKQLLRLGCETRPIKEALVHRMREWRWQWQLWKNWKVRTKSIVRDFNRHKNPINRGKGQKNLVDSVVKVLEDEEDEDKYEDKKNKDE